MHGLLDQKYLEVKKFFGDGFGGMHKMSVVQKIWASVYEDCKYLELRGVLRKNFRHKCMPCGLGIMAGFDWDCLM